MSEETHQFPVGTWNRVTPELELRLNSEEADHGPDPRKVGYYSFLWPDDDTGPWEVMFDATYIDGREEIIGVHIWHRLLSEPLTASLLRSFPVGTLIKHVQGKLRDALEKTVDMFPSDDPGRESWETLLAPLAEKRGRYPREHFENVAEIYNEAWKRHEPPTRAVADFYKVPRTTAGKWVARARKAGLLPATERRKAKGDAT